MFIDKYHGVIRLDGADQELLGTPRVADEVSIECTGQLVDRICVDELGYYAKLREKGLRRSMLTKIERLTALSEQLLKYYFDTGMCEIEQFVGEEARD